MLCRLLSGYSPMIPNSANKYNLHILKKVSSTDSNEGDELTFLSCIIFRSPM